MSLAAQKIVFTVTNDLSYDRRMHRICNTLSEAGAHVTLVGRRLKSSEPLEQYSFNTKRLNCLFTKGKFFYLEYNLRLLIYLLFAQYTIVCAIDLDTLLPATIASKLRNKLLGYDAHEYFTEVPEVVNRRAIKAIWSWIAQKCIPSTHFRYTVGTKLAQELQKQYGRPFEVIRNLPQLTQLEEGNSASPFILYQGALNEGRGLETLIKVAPKLPVPVKIAGEGDLSQELRQLAQKVGAQKQVEFLGFVKPENLSQLTARAFIGYNLLENKGKSYYFSLANKYFDYSMAAVPCLVSPFPEYLLLQEKYGHSIVCNLNEKDILEAVNKLNNNRAHYNLLKDNCIKFRADLNWENEARHLITIYEQVI